MKRTFFALFDSPKQATAAIAELESRGTSPVEHCSTIIHERGVEAGQTLVTVIAPRLSSEEATEQIFKEHGAQIVHKPVLGLRALI